MILPTDTVYGLCALPEHEDVLYELKGRDRSKPFALLTADVDTLVAAVPGLDPSVLEKYLPGPYTLIVGGEQRDRLRAVAALELVQDVLVLGQRTESVDGVGRQDHSAPSSQRRDRVLGHRRKSVSAARNASGCST